MAEPLVLLPGLMSDARVFWPQIAALSSTLSVTVAPVTLGERVEEIASGLLDQTPQVAAARELLIVKAKSGRMADVMNHEIQPGFLAPGPNRNAIIDIVMDMAETLGPEVYVRQARALQRGRDQQAVLRKCKVPALVMCGDVEKLNRIKRHSFMAELIPNATLSVIAGAGLLPTLEQPQASTVALRSWMKIPSALR